MPRMIKELHIKYFDDNEGKPIEHLSPDGAMVVTIEIDNNPGDIIQYINICTSEWDQWHVTRKKLPRSLAMELELLVTWCAPSQGWEIDSARWMEKERALKLYVTKEEVEEGDATGAFRPR